jgi:uncharacterized protein YkwD
MTTNASLTIQITYNRLLYHMKIHFQNRLNLTLRLSIISMLSFFSLHSFSQQFQTGSKVSYSDAQKMIDHHNMARKEVGVGKIEWDPALAEYAQRWAEHLSENNNCKMKHRSGSQRDGENYGENIFWGSSASAYGPLDASISWYSEKEIYRYARLDENNWYGTGHYTQMIWRKTTFMGAGVAICPSGAIIVVANYNPPGNYMGEYPY